MILTLCELQRAATWIWNLVTEAISSDLVHYSTSASIIRKLSFRTICSFYFVKYYTREDNHTKCGKKKFEIIYFLRMLCMCVYEYVYVCVTMHE